jgi:hypothetical protein
LELEKPIIIFGVGRSGTTLISEIIFQHNALAWPSTYQNRYPAKVWINKLRPFLDNRFWSLRGQKEQIDKIPFYKNYLFRPSEANAFWKYITRPETNFLYNFLLDKQVTSTEKQRIRNVFEKMVRYQKRKRLAVKLTGPGRIGYLKSIFPDAIFIEITREPFANIRSLLKVPFWKDRGMYKLWWQGAYTEDEQKMALNWKDKPALITALQYSKIRETTLQEAGLHKVQFYSFAYEDFVQNPQNIIAQILSVTGLKACNYVDKYLKSIKFHDRNSNALESFDVKDQVQLNLMLKNYLKHEN